MTTDNFLIQNLLIVLKKIYTFALSFNRQAFAYR